MFDGLISCCGYAVWCNIFLCVTSYALNNEALTLCLGLIKNMINDNMLNTKKTHKIDSFTEYICLTKTCNNLDNFSFSLQYFNLDISLF